MAARPWENRILDQSLKDGSDTISLKSHDDSLDARKGAKSRLTLSLGRSSMPTFRTSPTATTISVHRSATFGSQGTSARLSSVHSSDQQSEGSPTTSSRGTPKSNAPVLSQVAVAPKASIIVARIDEATGKPRYLTATKSAKAKVRSSSQPKQRPNDEAQPRKKRLSLPAPAKGSPDSKNGNKTPAKSEKAAKGDTTPNGDVRRPFR